MLSINGAFNWLVTMAGVSLVVLALGTLLTWCWTRPIERLRSIQTTIVAIAVACLLQQFRILPQVSLGWLPNNHAPSVQSAPGEAVDLARSSRNLRSVDSPPIDTHEESASDVAANQKLATANPAAESRSITTPAATESTRFHSTARLVINADRLRAAVVITFLTGFAWTLLNLIFGTIRLRTLRRHSTSAGAEIVALLRDQSSTLAGRITLLVSSEIDVPLTFGIRRPVIMLPAAMVESARRVVLRDCLAHECSHIRHHDIAQWWSLQALQPLFWYQPLYWLLRRELRLCQDQLADHVAARQRTDALSYAEVLLELAKTRQRIQTSLALTMNDGRSNLFRRVQLLVSANHHLAAACRWWSVCGAIAALLLVTGALGTINLGRAEVVDEGAASGGATTPATIKPSESRQSNEKMDTKPAAEAKAMPVGEPLKSGGDVAKKPTVDADPSIMGEDLPDGSLRYSGVVVDRESQKPIAGAVVTVRRMIVASYEHKTLEETKHTSDDNGKYSFVIPPKQLAEKSLYIELDVAHDDHAPRSGFGYALGMIRKNAKLGDPPFYAKIELDPCEFITGRLVDPDGKPVSGAPIEAFSTPNARDFEASSWFNTKSDAEGKFRLSLAKGGPSVFWIVPEKLAPKQVVSGTKRGDLGDVQLEPGVAVKGQVVDATGKPLAGAWVNLTDRKSQQEIQIPVASQLSRSGQADAEGHFELGPLKPGQFELEVDTYPREIRYRPFERTKLELPAVFPRRTITINEGLSEPLMIRAVPHVRFEAQYLDSKGEHRGGWEQMIYGRLDGDSFFGQLRANADGHIEGMVPLGLENAQLNLSSNEHGALRVRLGKDKPLTHGRRIELGTIEGDIAGVEIIKYTAPIVQLKVVDEQGKQIPNVKVAGVYEADDKDKLVFPVNGMPTSIFFEHQPGGVLRTSQMLPDEKTKIVASAEGYEDAQETLSLPEGETRELTLVLKRTVAAADQSNAAPAAKMEKPEK